MAYLKVSPFLYIFILINHSVAVLNNSGNKNENVDVNRILCVGGDVTHGNDETLEPIVVATENGSSVKVKKVAGSITDRMSAISSQYKLPHQGFGNQGPIFMPTKSFHSFDLRVPDVFPLQPQVLNSFPQFGNVIHKKRLQFGAHYTPAFSTFFNNQINLLNTNTIPTSLEAYGPPINKLVRPYFPSLSSQNSLLNEHQKSSATSQILNNIHSDLSSNVGIFAPPTPSDIKYDGWRPIPGHVSSSNRPLLLEQAKNEHVISSLSSNNNLVQLPAKEGSHSPRQLSDSPTEIPSNSYGEPINNPEDHNLKQSVRQGHTSKGLPPQIIPEHEPFHVNQGPTTMIFSTSTPSVANTINDNHHQNLLEPLQLPHIENNPPGLFRPQSSHGQINSNDFHTENNLLSQQLPSLSSAPFTTFTDSVDDFGSSYLAPPPSSFSSSGPYAPSRRPSYYVGPSRKPFKVAGNGGIRNVGKFVHPRNRGILRTQLTFATVPLINDYVPPNNSPHANFRQNIPQPLPVNSIHDDFVLSSSSSSSSGSHESTFSSNFIKDTQYTSSLDSYGSSSSDQLALTDSTNQSKHQGFELPSVIDHSQTDDTLGTNTNGDIGLSASDEFEHFRHENSEAAQALAQALTSENVSSDSIQIQGSKDSYLLQIQPSTGAMDNVDGSIKHEQILSEGLLHDILTAIEQPGNDANVQIFSNPPVQSIEEVQEQLTDPLPLETLPYSSFHTDAVGAASQLYEQPIRAPPSDKEGMKVLSSVNNAALFFNNHFDESSNREESSSSSHDTKSIRTNIN